MYQTCNSEKNILNMLKRIYCILFYRKIKLIINWHFLEFKEVGAVGSSHAIYITPGI